MEYTSSPAQPSRRGKEARRGEAAAPLWHNHLHLHLHPTAPACRAKQSKAGGTSAGQRMQFTPLQRWFSQSDASTKATNRSRAMRHTQCCRIFLLSGVPPGGLSGRNVVMHGRRAGGAFCVRSSAPAATRPQ
eukprot:TRINITY_DN663_c0_g1_i14.p1 TRINITY_DN663_c0_g1~~TRINITY_DN663_c0_g1_i14.p1  ORF type:complete len:132 (-),score=11.88 TRINITY_DN663_c0_g1_i14:820-1215(-)